MAKRRRKKGRSKSGIVGFAIALIVILAAVYISVKMVPSNEENSLTGKVTGPNFCDLVAEYSIDTASISTCGEYQVYKGSNFVPEFEEAALSMEVDELRLVPSQYGVHIMWLVEKVPLEDVRENIINTLTIGESRELLNLYLDDLRNDAEITYLNDSNSSNGELVYVNDLVISQNDLDAKYAELPVEYQALVLKEDLLSEMIDEILLNQEVENLGIEVLEEEIDQTIEEIGLQQGLSLEQMDSILQQQGQSLDAFRDELRSQLSLQKLFEQVVSVPEVSEDKIIEGYDELNPVNVRHILIGFEEGESEDSLMQRAQDVLDKIVLPGAETDEEVVVEELVIEFEEVEETPEEELIIEFEEIFEEETVEETSEEEMEVIEEVEEVVVEETPVEEFQETEILIPIDEVAGNDLMSCLIDAKLYGAYWDSQTKKQLELFDGEVDFYVECFQPGSFRTKKAICEDIRAFPTWEIDGVIIEGYQSLNSLKGLTGC